MRGQNSRLWKGVAALACLVIAYSAKAHAEDNQELTAQNLYDICTNNSQDVQRGCGLWIHGFARGMQYSQIFAYHEHLRAVTCLPASLTGGQARVIIEKYMQDHPEELHFQAVAVAGGALVRAFPCEK